MVIYEQGRDSHGIWLYFLRTLTATSLTYFMDSTRKGNYPKETPDLAQYSRTFQVR
jgi:hypothetical protein